MNSDMQGGEVNCALPVGIESFEKYQRKAAKLIGSLELELEERSQVDNVLNFFNEGTSKDFLDDDAFYRLDGGSAGGTTASQPSGQGLPSELFKMSQPKNGGLAEALSDKNLLSMQMTPLRNGQHDLLQNQTVGARNNKQLLSEIDPQNLMDDQQSVYSTSQKSNVLPNQQEAGDKDETASQFLRKPMTKKELQAFMKAKLAKTKINDSVTTQAAATGQVQKNFTMKGRQQEPTQRRDFTDPSRKPPAHKRAGPNTTPSTQKGKGTVREPSEDDSGDDDIAAANERMKQAALKFQINSNSGAPNRKTGKRSQSRGLAEHTTKTRSTAKNIYKPCFNMPAKEQSKGEGKIDKQKSSKRNPTAAGKEYAEAQRLKQRQSSQQRSRSKVPVEDSSAANQTGTKVFSKPKISSSKGSRASNAATAAPSQLSQTSQATSSRKPPLKPSESRSSFVPDSSTDKHANESSEREQQQKSADNDFMNANEEIESRYSDDNEEQKESNQESEEQKDSTKLANNQRLSVEGADYDQKANHIESATTTDLNGHNDDQAADQLTSQHAPIQSTADLIMQRAEANGEFDQFKSEEQEDGETTMNTPKDIIGDEVEPRNESQPGTEDGEFTLGPSGFQQVNDTQKATEQKFEGEKHDHEKGVQNDANQEDSEFYSASDMTKSPSQLKIQLLDASIKEFKDDKSDEDEVYTKNRERIEEIKRQQLDSENEDQPDATGAIDSKPIIIDIEAEIAALDQDQLAGSAKDAIEAKVELDSRLEKAAEEAKAKGKRTVRTFDMLRKAISGDAEQIKKQQEDLTQKAEAEVEANSKARELEYSAKKSQSGATETPAKQEATEEKSVQKVKSQTGTTNQEKETPAKKLLIGAAALTTTKTSTIAKKKIAAARNDKNNPFNKQRGLILAEESVDYSHIYRNFYDIFVGCFTDTKGFDVTFTLRETRNIYASFVNLMSSDLLLSQKHKFDKHPLEFGYKDQSAQQQAPNHLGMVGQKLNELEMMIQNRDSNMSIKQQQKALMMAAMTQAQLREKYKQLKNKDQDEINREAQLLTAAAEPADADSETPTVDQLSQKQPAAAQEKPSQLFYRVVKNKTEVYDIITRSFNRKPRWNELPHGLDLRNCWNLMWVWSKLQKDMTRLLVWQRANHFIGAKNVSRKDFLKRNIERAQKFSGRARQCFDIMPLTYILPKEYVAFLETFSDLEDKEGKYNYWIMKPAAASRGRGISVVNDISQVTYGEPMVMQRYIKNPLLLNGYKFDLRIYVLVTSVNPLEMFIYKEGFGRFSTVPYTLDPNDKANKYVHLTNVSINKYNLKNYDCQQQDRIYGGTKVSLETLKKTFVNDLNIDWDNVVWTQIKQVCVKAMVSAQNDIPFNPNCFDLYGFDVILDEDLKAWLLEINASPSLSCETLLDDMIKQRLIDDTIDLIDPIDFDRKRLFEVLERRSQEEFGGGKTASNAHQKRTMNKDLTYILHGQVPRAYGEMPRNLGNYERACPDAASENYMKLIGGQKMFGSQMKVSEKITPAQREKVRGPGSMPNLSDKQSEQNKAQAQKVMGGAVSSVTARKQQSQQHQINLHEISNVSQHRTMVQK